MQTVLSRPASLRWLESSVVLSRGVLGAVAVLAAAAAAAFDAGQGVAVVVVTGVGMFLLGYVAERTRRINQHSERLRRILTRAYAQPGIRGLLETTFDELSAVVGSHVMVIAARDRRRGETFAWQVRRTSADAAIAVITLAECKESEFLFVPAEEIWRLQIADGRIAARTVIDGNGADDVADPGAAIMSMSPRSLVAMTVALWDRWDATVICLDPDPATSTTELRLAREIVRELRAPALNAFDLSRMRNRVASAQRAKLARDLHDGILQSLIGLELKTHALRERIVQKDPDTAAGLGQIQRALRKEATEARRLMQDLRAGVVEPHQLAEAMSAAVMKFQHDTGVTTTFEANDTQSAVSVRVSAELTRILQEALSNVRRHSRARTVAVQLGHSNGACSLTI